MISVKYFDTINNVFKEIAPIYQNLSFTQPVDAYGEASFEYPLTDDRSDFLTIRNRVHILADNEFFGGYITEIDKVLQEDVPFVRIKLVSYLEDFVRDIFVPNFRIPNIPLNDLLDPSHPDTIIISPWQTIVQSSSKSFSYLVSLQSYMEVFQQIREHTGFHFRYAGTPNNPYIIEFGEFGTIQPLKIRKNPDTRYCTSVGYAYIESLSEKENATEHYNVIYPIGGGDDNGLNQLTLRDSIGQSYINPSYTPQIDPVTPNTDGGIYTPSTFSNIRLAPNTYRAYYLIDPISVAQYGVIKRAKSYKDIHVVANSTSEFTDTDRLTASKELYETALQDLLIHAYPQKTYDLSLNGDLSSVMVGDKVTLKYKDWITRFCNNQTTERVFIDIDTNLYITSKSISINEDGVVITTCEASNILEGWRTDTEILQRTITTVKDYGSQRKGSVSNYTYTFQDNISDGKPLKGMFFISLNMMYLNYLRLRVQVSPYRQTTGGGIIEDMTYPTGIVFKVDGIDYSAFVDLNTPPAFGTFPALSSEMWDLLYFADQLGQLNNLSQTGEHFIEIDCVGGKGYFQVYLETQQYLASS